jgi:hypothetical protein
MNEDRLGILKATVNKGGYEFKQKEEFSTQYSIQKKN